MKPKCVQKGFQTLYAVNAALPSVQVPKTEDEARRWIADEYADGDDASLALRAARAGLSQLEYLKRENGLTALRATAAREGRRRPRSPATTSRARNGRASTSGVLWTRRRWARSAGRRRISSAIG